MQDSAFGVGVYSFADAARFIDASARELRRWALGYSFAGRDGEQRSSPPLLASRQLAGTDYDGIGFRDLLELRFIKAFRDNGVSLQAIRRAAENARDLMRAEHPFTCRKFQTDGRSIFVTIHEETGDESLVDIVRRQDVFQKIVGPALYSGIEFDDRDGAIRWYPVARSKQVVMDPERAFGQPIIAGYGVPTIAIMEALGAENGDVSRVAELFEVPREAVLKARKFELSVSQHA
jgi:uncharacterized protein (DUF433 family)/DNA-binding transcriptional MerR regulator